MMKVMVTSMKAFLAAVVGRTTANGTTGTTTTMMTYRDESGVLVLYRLPPLPTHDTASSSLAAFRFFLAVAVVIGCWWTVQQLQRFWRGVVAGLMMDVCDSMLWHGVDVVRKLQDLIHGPRSFKVHYTREEARRIFPLGWEYLVDPEGDDEYDDDGQYDEDKDGDDDDHHSESSIESAIDEPSVCIAVDVAMVDDDEQPTASMMMMMMNEVDGTSNDNNKESSLAKEMAALIVTTPTMVVGVLTEDDVDDDDTNTSTTVSLSTTITSDDDDEDHETTTGSSTSSVVSDDNNCYANPFLRFHSRYKLGEVLGEGGYGKVYRAKDVSGKSYAVKMIMTTDDMLINVEDEIDTLFDLLGNDYVVQIHEVYDLPPHHCAVVMEECRGGSLYDRLEQKGVYTEREGLILCRNVLRGLQHVHETGYVHLDIKPGNILLVEQDDDTTIKIADFGLSQRVYSPKSLEYGGGTPGFMAPEIIADEKFDQRVDMFSLGLMMLIVLGGVDGYNGVRCIPQFGSGTVSFGTQLLIESMLAMNMDDRCSAKEALKVVEELISENRFFAASPAPTVVVPIVAPIVVTDSSTMLNPAPNHTCQAPVVVGLMMNWSACAEDF